MIRQLTRILGEGQGGQLRRYLLLTALSAALQGVAVLSIVPIIAALVDGDAASAWTWIGVMAALVLVAAVLHYAQAMGGFRVAIALLTGLQHRVGDHVAALPISWFGGERVGRLSRIVTTGTVALGSLPAHLIQPLVIGVVTPLTVVVGLLVVDWRMGLVALLSAPLLALSFRWSAGLIGRGNEPVHASADGVAERAVEFAKAQRVLRAFGRSGSRYEPLERAIGEHETAQLRSMRVIVPGTILSGVLVQLALSALVAVGCWLALSGAAQPGALVAALVLAARFAGPIAEVGELMGAVRMAQTDLRSITEVLDAPALPAPEADAAAPADATVRFEGVRFGYEDGATVLGGIDLEAPHGTMLAIVGPSGVGKSTLMSLVPRFADVAGGAISIGGVDVRELSTPSLMAQVAMIFQQVYLFDGTLEQNVRFGRELADDAEVRRAAELAGVDEIAARLPDGWATRVGEGGSLLSGGERQRVSIARALLKQAPIVLVDEATAALDGENERIVRASLDALRGTSTVIVIAHRLATIAGADRIAVLAAGADGAVVAETGTHDELLAADGAYAAQWRERLGATGWRIASERAAQR